MIHRDKKKYDKLILVTKSSRISIMEFLACCGCRYGRGASALKGKAAGNDGAVRDARHDSHHSDKAGIKGKGGTGDRKKPKPRAVASGQKQRDNAGATHTRKETPHVQRPRQQAASQRAGGAQHKAIAGSNGADSVGSGQGRKPGLRVKSRSKHSAQQHHASHSTAADPRHRLRQQVLMEQAQRRRDNRDDFSEEDDTQGGIGAAADASSARAGSPKLASVVSMLQLINGLIPQATSGSSRAVEAFPAHPSMDAAQGGLPAPLPIKPHAGPRQRRGAMSMKRSPRPGSSPRTVQAIPKMIQRFPVFFAIETAP